MSKLRKAASTKLINSKPVQINSNIRARAPAPKVAKTSNKRKRGGVLSDDHSGDESMASGLDTDSDTVGGNGPLTPVASPKPKKTRVSPRSTSKKGYKALDDPYLHANAADGEGNDMVVSDSSECEESIESDDEYWKAEGLAEIVV
ncbi:MAG: hypothetical protein Q9217_006958 [Psora testacea]